MREALGHFELDLLAVVVRVRGVHRNQLALQGVLVLVESGPFRERFKKAQPKFAAEMYAIIDFFQMVVFR